MTSVGEIFDGELADAAKYRVIGQVATDHRIDFRRRLPAITSTEHVGGMQTLHERFAHLLLENSGIDFHGNCLRAVADLASDSGDNLSPALPH